MFITKVKGYWKKTGKLIEIKNAWSNHEFTPPELEALFNDETIEIVAVNKSGKSFIVSGKLEEQEFNGHKYIGFKPDFSKSTPTSTSTTTSTSGTSYKNYKVITVDGEEALFNSIVCGKQLSDLEMYILALGGTISFYTNIDNEEVCIEGHIETNTSRNGKKYANFVENI